MAIPKSIHHVLVISYILKIYKHNSKNFFDASFKIIAKVYFVQVQEWEKSIDFMESKLSKIKADYFFYSNTNKLTEVVV